MATSPPPLDEIQMAKAIAAYYSAREQAVRYVLGALDPSALDAPALPYPEVLTRVQGLLTTELRRCAMAAQAEDPPEVEQESSAADEGDINV